MNFRRIFLVLALGATFPALAAAQSNRPIVGMSYQMGLPYGDTKAFTDNDSWIGLGLSSNWMKGDHASVGIYLGWNEFYERTTETLEIQNGTIFGNQYRDYNIFPMLLTGKIYIGNVDKRRRLFLGVGAGAYYVHQTFDIGLSTLYEDNWHFGVAPEAGFLINGFRGTGVELAARYHYPMSGGTYLQGKAQSPQYLTVGLGFYSMPF